jgi:protein gp37
MSDNTGIEWCDATWNVVIGCDKVSPGCDHCYAIRTAHRMQANPNPKVREPYAGTESGGEWTGRVNLVADRLSLPLQWKRPRRIFVNAQSDLFHDQVPDDYIANVFAVMARATQHTFQLLTKRHARMRALLNSDLFRRRMYDYLVCLDLTWIDAHPVLWPLPNVWLGVSTENQKWVDIRIPALLDTPAAVRFISAEPLLGPIELQFEHHYEPDHTNCSGLVSPAHEPACGREPGKHWGIDWVITGGESGPGARPAHPQWFRSIRDQCQAAGVAYLHKQHGEWIEDVTEHPADPELGIDEPYRVLNVPSDAKSGNRCAMHLSGSTALTPDNPFNPFRAGHGGWTAMRRVGKTRAGRVLDGRTWDEFPGVAG